jgi:hypothetical protein
MFELSSIYRVNNSDKEDILSSHHKNAYFFAELPRHCLGKVAMRHYKEPINIIINSLGKVAMQPYILRADKHNSLGKVALRNYIELKHFEKKFAQ